jgi:hypothetical protein
MTVLHALHRSQPRPRARLRRLWLFAVSFFAPRLERPRSDSRRSLNLQTFHDPLPRSEILGCPQPSAALNMYCARCASAPSMNPIRASASDVMDDRERRTSPFFAQYSLLQTSCRMVSANSCCVTGSSVLLRAWCPDTRQMRPKSWDTLPNCQWRFNFSCEIFGPP